MIVCVEAAAAQKGSDAPNSPPPAESDLLAHGADGAGSAPTSIPRQLPSTFFSRFGLRGGRCPNFSSYCVAIVIRSQLPGDLDSPAASASSRAISSSVMRKVKFLFVSPIRGPFGADVKLPSPTGPVKRMRRTGLGDKPNKSLQLKTPCA